MRSLYYAKARSLCTYPRKAFYLMRSLQERFQSAGFAGKLPLAMMPLLLSRAERKRIQEACEMLASVIEKTMSALFTSPKVKEYASYESIPRSWVEVSPVCKQNAIVARLDFIFDGTHLKLIEVQTDNPGFQAITHFMPEIYRNHPFYRPFTRFAEGKGSLLYDHMKKTIESVYKESRPSAGSKPTIAFVDYEDSNSLPEAILGAKYWKALGFDAFVADPRQFTFKDGACYAQGKRVDIVRRSMKAMDFLRDQSKNEGFLKGYAQNAFVMMNSFRSVYGDEKSLFSLLSNPEYHHLYAPQEIRALKAHIPWTRMLSEQDTTGLQGEKIHLEEFVKGSRERLVLKTTRVLSGKDVFLGIETPAPEWEKILLTQRGNREWIVQEYVPLRAIPLPTFCAREVRPKPHSFVLCCFVVGGTLAGISGRFSDVPLLPPGKAGGILPVFSY